MIHHVKLTISHQVRQAEGLEKVVSGASRLVERSRKALEIFRSKTGVNKAPGPAVMEIFYACRCNSCSLCYIPCSILQRDITRLLKWLCLEKAFNVIWFFTLTYF